jgi:hypothetical protein
MSLANTKKAAPTSNGGAWAGAVARIRRGGGTARLGRRSALLGVLTSMYANSTRGGAAASTRIAGDVRTANSGTDRS